MKKQTKIPGICFFFVVIVLLFSFLFLKKKSPDTNNYNVVFIVADALRLDVLGCYGGDARTPHIDWLAENGVLFENAYSTAPCTMPSSVSMLTGNYSRTYGIVKKDVYKKRKPKGEGKSKGTPKRQYSYYVNDKEKLLAEALEEKGFDVLADVENAIASRSNNLQGFTKLRKKKKMNKKEIALVENNVEIRDIDCEAYSRLSPGYKCLYGVLYYLLTVPDQQNFFLLKWFLDPHAPYDPLEKFRKKIPLEPGKLSRAESFYSENLLKPFKKLIKENKFSSYDYFYLKALYKAEVESIDQRVGYIIKALRLRGLLKKTFIVFTSDHGEYFGEHGQLGHGNSFFQTMVHIPLIVAGPGIPKGKREKTVVSHLDLMPTLKDFLGVQYDDNMKGESYRPLFDSEPIWQRSPYFDRRSHFTSLNSESDAMLLDGYKLIVNKKNNRYVFELFSINDDPEERENISEENPRTRKRIFKKMLEIRKENKRRLKRNLAKIGKHVNLELEKKKTLEQLKSLGYVE